MSFGLHWARAPIETPVRIRDVQEPVVALVDHGSEINLMSMDFYKKGKWPINTKHVVVKEKDDRGDDTKQATGEKDDSTEESWHDANEGCDMACKTVNEGTRERPDRGPVVVR